MLAHRREIIAQTSDKLAAGIGHGIIQAGFSPRPLERVQVARIQTLWARAVPIDDMEMPPADLLIIDEATTARRGATRRSSPPIPTRSLLGLTATPCRGDGRGLGGIFDTIIECPQVAALSSRAIWSRRASMRRSIPICAAWRSARRLRREPTRRAHGRPNWSAMSSCTGSSTASVDQTVCFAVNVQHSIHLRDEFIRAGVRAEHIDGTTPKPERDAALARLKSGEIELVTNCMVLTEGWDMPQVGCCILARPTKKMGLFRQMIGRVLRPAEGKPDAIILDHSGAVFRHGFAEDHVDWVLGPTRRPRAPPMPPAALIQSRA